MNHVSLASRLLHPFEEKMRQTGQSPRWHGEGDVYTHTLMVADALRELPEFTRLDTRRREMLEMAALLHDIGKIRTTEVVEGRIEAPRHAPVGSRMARELLWREHGLCGTEEGMRMRETVCTLVARHTTPFHVIDSTDGGRTLHRLAAASLVMPDFSLRMLTMLARADILGRICDDREEHLYKVELCCELAREEGCFDECYPFPSDLTRHRLVNGDDVWKDQTLHDPTWGEVVMMSGLPGTGKDTWIATHFRDMPMVSLDAIRRRIGVSPTKNQGRVANMAREEAKQLLRARTPFVWNATNLTREMRLQLVSLFETYGARVRIVYLETDWDTLLRRNASREEKVPLSVISDMLGKLAPPLPWEARVVEWHAV